MERGNFEPPDDVRIHCYGSRQEGRASGGSQHVRKEERVLQEGREGLETRVFVLRTTWYRKIDFNCSMANYPRFDVYDLELKKMRGNSDLRKLLVHTKNRSIIVIEDIDACGVGLQNRETQNDSRNSNFYVEKISLSGLLNFVDGLWSSCGDERIIVFTTNHKERLDPALLRPGRMDVQVEMSYCTYGGFKVLASSYLQVKEEEKVELFGEIEGLLKKVEVTPAEIAGELMKKTENVESI
ncbi:hypothetical protein L2E82_46793 [Cichorium intybus]|uniref:Uncharacterized protein n=1 Tax=Cichorium intybus TaxID=13427 RepID=A0ACB8YTS2_CICIN|nr:hypothetical protein L2E82_46793 [Cichorium intybus]